MSLLCYVDVILLSFETNYELSDKTLNTDIIRTSTRTPNQQHYHFPKASSIQIFSHLFSAPLTLIHVIFWSTQELDERKML